MYTIFIISIALVILLVINLHIKIKSRKNNYNKIKMIEWMKMSVEERKLFVREDMDKAMKRKKDLLKNIRKEYKRIEDSKR
tara:strand:- start:1688 stop:1930 length:243 start_codon:yes stop_codon:yes gene_type:complete